jgi:hypothetical protein
VVQALPRIDEEEATYVSRKSREAVPSRRTVSGRNRAPAQILPLPEYLSRKEAPAATIFEQEWWLLAASGGRLERAEVRWDGAVVGSFSYQWSASRFVRKITPPPYTRILAPRLNGPEGKEVTVLENNTRIVRELLEKMGPFDSFTTTLPAESDLLLPFQFNGAAAVVKGSFISSLDVTIQDAWDAIHKKTRNVIRSAAGRLSYSIHTDLERFIRIAKLRDAGVDYNDYQALTRLWVEISRRDCGRIISAVNDAGSDVAACVVVWDDKTAYYLLSTRSSDSEAGKANTALFFESLSLAKRLKRDFDADGYATLQSGRFLSRFGLAFSARATVEKRGALYGALKPIKDFFVPAQAL